MSKINKIVELLIDWENMSIDDVGVEIMSLVSTPAIGTEWLYFSDDSIIESDDILQLIHTDGFGEVLDPENIVEIDFTKSKFDTQEEVVDAVVGAAIAGLRDASSEGEVKYRYAGPFSTRPFCAAMLALNKVYTDTELQVMGTTVTNGIDDSTEAITRWHGGPNCRHWFDTVRIFRSGNGPVTVVNEGRVNDNDPDSAMYQAGETMASRGLNGYRSQASKKKAEQWYAIQKSYNSNFSEMHFAFDGDKRIVTGPAMRAGQLIPRKDEDGNLFHVYFSADTIQKISEKFLEENKQHNTDVNHSMEADTENTLLESWLVADPELDKSKALGFNPTKGDWYVSYKINNDETWEQIKAGELTGFSIAGQFIELAKTN